MQTSPTVSFKIAREAFSSISPPWTRFTQPDHGAAPGDDQEGICPLIHIDAERLPNDEWAVSVRDNGIGIAPEYHERIFSPFKRLHGREIPGTGIGLAVCRRIIENHGGGIWVEAQTGEGSRFFVRLKAA